MTHLVSGATVTVTVTSMDSHGSGLGRFGLCTTPHIVELLAKVAASQQAPQELKQLCQDHLGQKTIPWKLIHSACAELRRHSHEGSDVAAALLDVTGSSLVLPRPPVRQRSKQLQQRLVKLQEQIDEQRYAAMVADVATAEQQAAAALSDPFFPTTKLQLSFGMHVIVTMGAFFALFYYAGRFLMPENKTWAALLGALGLTAGLLLETTLLIIRQNIPEPLNKKYAHLVGDQWQQQQQRKVTPSKERAKGEVLYDGSTQKGRQENAEQQQQRIAKKTQ